MSANVESMMSVVELPWHRAGTILKQPPTSHQAITAAGLDWSVETRPLFVNSALPGEAEKLVKVNDRKAVVRLKDGKYLGDVGVRYRPIQNIDCFSFTDSIVKDGKLTYETAGSLNEGRRIWILAKLDEVFSVGKDDEVAQYLLLSSSHDGSSSVSTIMTPIRVVCMNTLSMALKDQRKGFKIRHTPSAPVTMDQMSNLLSKIRDNFAKTAEIYNALKGKSLKVKDIDNLNLRLFGKEDGTYSVLTQFKMSQITQMFEGQAIGSDIAGKTAWGWWNSVCQYVQMEISRTPSKRLESLWFGHSAYIRNKAMDVALELIK